MIRTDDSWRRHACDSSRRARLPLGSARPPSLLALPVAATERVRPSSAPTRSPLPVSAVHAAQQPREAASFACAAFAQADLAATAS